MARATPGKRTALAVLCVATTTWAGAMLAAASRQEAPASGAPAEGAPARQAQPAPATQGQPAPAGQGQAAGAGQGQASGTLPAGYAGEEACLTCHGDQSYKGTAHARLKNPRTPAATHGCESCHGPGQAHVDAGGDRTLIVTFGEDTSPEAASAQCTTCHTRGGHALWEASPHDRRDVACTTCHSGHVAQSMRAMLKAPDETVLCSRCHRDKVSRLDRSGHMPVREGKMECSSCHNVHGSQNVRLLRAGFSVSESCQSCHTDKRGPFLWEHAPVRENCTTCHDPHGSGNDRMLVAKQPFLCQRCHAHTRHPGTIYDATVLASSNRLYGRSCVNCHSNVHGSNHPSGWSFLR